MEYIDNVFIKDALKTFRDDQDKILSPRLTLDIFKKKLKSSNFNILKDTIRIDNGRLNIPVFFSVCSSDSYKLIGTKKQMGKGFSTAQAEASAVMELAERYSFFNFYKNSKNILINTYDNVSSDALSFESILKSVNDDSDDYLIAEKIFRSIPLKWTWSYNLTKGKKILIPIEWFYTINAFNGSSAGNCLEETICQGICEVLERHVSSIVCEDKICTPMIFLNSIKNFAVLNMIEKYNNAKIKLKITDFTLNTGIPSVGVLAYDPFTFPNKSEIVWTAGTATSPEKALSRALTEVAQLAGDFNTNSCYEASGLPKFNSFVDCSFILETNNAINITKLPNISDKNIKIEIESCVNTLANIGMEIIVVDVTDPILNIPSSYTIIPGTCFRERANKTSVIMFLAKIISKNFSPVESLERLKYINNILPNRYFICFYIGKGYLDLKQYNLAIYYFFKAVDLSSNPQDISIVYFYLALSYKDIGEYEKAVYFLRKGELLDNNRTDIYNLLGYCFFKLKKYNDAVNNFKKVIDLNPGSAIDYANLALNYENMGKKGEAIYYYRLAIKIDPFIGFANENLRILLGD